MPATHREERQRGKWVVAIITELPLGEREAAPRTAKKHGLIILVLFQMLWIAGRARIFKQSMGARNRVRIGLSYRPARLHRLAELMPWNRSLSALKL